MNPYEFLEQTTGLISTVWTIFIFRLVLVGWRISRRLSHLNIWKISRKAILGW